MDIKIFEDYDLVASHYQQLNQNKDGKLSVTSSPPSDGLEASAGPPRPPFRVKILRIPSCHTKA